MPAPSVRHKMIMIAHVLVELAPNMRQRANETTKSGCIGVVFPQAVIPVGTKPCHGFTGEQILLPGIQASHQFSEIPLPAQHKKGELEGFLRKPDALCIPQDVGHGPC